MPRVYRLSKIGAQLPRCYSYGPATTPDACQDGFEAFKGPVFSIANTIGPTPGSLGEGDFTAAAGYDLLLLIDVRAVQGHPWNPFSWVACFPSDVERVAALPVRDLHAWLEKQRGCLGPDGQLSRASVVSWVRENQALVEAWLEEHSENEPVQFVQIIVGTESKR